MLLKMVRWFGMACFQFQVPDDGIPLLIDFNGRMVGDSAFASLCGFRGHEAWARLATRRPLGQHHMRHVPAGSLYHAIDGDLWRVTRCSTGPLAFARAIAELLRYSKRAVHPVLLRGDMLPVLSCFAWILARIVRRLLRRAAFACRLHQGQAP